MKKSISYRQMMGFLFTSVLGTFLHFLFDLTGGSLPAALVSAVNESIWEHMKLLFYPIMLFALAEYRTWEKEKTGFWCVKLKGILLGLVLIPVLYYTYLGAWGKQITWFNIAIYAIAVLASFLLETRLRRKGRLEAGWLQVLGLAVLLELAVLFVLWTYEPPRIPLFQDPRTLTYGIRF